MAPTAVSRTSPRTEDRDQRVYLHGVTWEQYETILAIRGESSGVRITYLKGELELMTPSWSHEWLKKLLARLLEAYAEEQDLEITGVGSWTIKEEDEERGAEPDECYVLGSEKKARPDLAIEVVWTSGGIDKLEVYRKLGVREVWYWKDEVLRAFELVDDAYQPRDQSVLFPDLDLGKLAEFARYDKQTAAVRAFRKWLQETAPLDSA